jgi:hypothetical protein
MNEQFGESVDMLGVAGQVSQMNRMNNSAQHYLENQETGLAESQLECEKLLKKARHMLRQDKKRYDENGKLIWKKIKMQKRVLTNYGVENIMQDLEFYINKETLLSYYEESLIKQRLREFSLALNGKIYQKYELFFRTPSVEEAIGIIKKRIKEKVTIREGIHDILGVPFNKQEYNEEVLKDMEKVMEKEIEEVRKQYLKKNLAEWESLFWKLVHLVETVHQRAYRGEERGSLRRHTSINEVIGKMPIQQQQGFFKKMFSQ